MTKLNPDMQSFCEALAAKHGITLDRPDAHLRLSMPPSLQLFLLVLDPTTVAVSISFGECALISMHFDTSRVPWLLIGVALPIGQGGALALQRPEGFEILDPDFQEKAAKYVEQLAHELRVQGWLARPLVA